MSRAVVDGPACIFEYAQNGVKKGRVWLVDRRAMPMRALIAVRRDFNKLIAERRHDWPFIFRSQGARFEYRPITMIDPQVWTAVRQAAIHAPLKFRLKKHNRELMRK